MSRTLENKVLRIYVGPDGTALFPTRSNYNTRAYGRDVLYSAVLGRLVHVDRTGRVAPGLLSEFTSSADHRVWTLRLREGVRFHHGRPATAVDLEYSLVRYLLSPHASPGKAMRLHIQGADEVKPNSRFQSGIVSGVKPINDRTVQVTLTSADPNFARRISNPRDSLVPIEEIDDDHFCWKRSPVGAGPYAIESVSADQSTIVVRPYGELLAEAPQQIVFRNARASDESFDVVTTLKSNPNPKSLQRTSVGVAGTITGIYFNYQSAMARNVLFRQAVAHAVDRGALIEGMPATRPIDTMLSSDFGGGAIQFPEYHPEKARRLFDQVFGNLPKKISIPFAHADLDAPENIWVKRLVAQLEVVGVELEVVPGTMSVFDPKDDRSAFFLLGFIPDVADAGTLYQVFKPGGPWISRLDRPVPKFNDLLAQLPAKGSCPETIRGLVEVFHDEKLAVPLFEQELTYWTDPTNVTSLGGDLQTHILRFDIIQMK